MNTHYKGRINPEIIFFFNKKINASKVVHSSIIFVCFATMIKNSVLCIFSLIALTSASQQLPELKWKNMNFLAFDLPQEQYTSDTICFFNALLMRPAYVDVTSEESTFSFTNQAQPLDVYKYWEQKGEEQYDVLFTKVAYVLDQPVNFFSKERLSNPTYISQTMPAAKIKQSDSTYHLSVGFGAPDIDYTLQFYSPEEFEFRYPKLPEYFKEHDGLTQLPSLIVVQHNSKYGKVMFQQTSKMSISISRYFQLNEGQTLVFNYTLNYIHNMPPTFIGGNDFLMHKIKDGIKELIYETQYICRMEN
jgi:hypothetical protein